MYSVLACYYSTPWIYIKRTINGSTEDKISGEERKHDPEEVFTDSVDRVGGYQLNSSESRNESNMNINNNSE